MIDLRQSPRYKNYMEALGWEAEKVNNCQIFIKKLPLGLGSLIKILRPSPPIPFEKIDKIAKKYKAWFVKLEPNVTVHSLQLTVDSLQKHGFRPSSWPLAPSKTLQIDLTQLKETLFKQCEKRTRNTIKRAVRKGVVLAQSRDIEQFCLLWINNMRRKWNLFAGGSEIKSLWRAFGKDAYLLLAFLQSPERKIETLAGAFFLKHRNTFYYLYAASNQKGNKFGAPSLVLWEGILLSKKLGCKVFDLEGIYDPRYSGAQKGWRGFSWFKRGFGGEDVEYLGSFIKCYNRFASLFLISAL